MPGPAWLAVTETVRREMDSGDVLPATSGQHVCNGQTVDTLFRLCGPVRSLLHSLIFNFFPNPL